MSLFETGRYRKLRPYIHLVVWALYTVVILVPNYMRLAGVWKLFIPAYLLILASSYYYNSIILVPKYFSRGAYKKYITGSLYLVFAGIVLISVSLFLISQADKYETYRLWVVSLKGAVAYIVESSVLILAKVAKEWYLQSQRLREVEYQKVRFELQLLKKQLDPHFIFNTLNNIYLLVINKSGHAPDAILRFSELFDYILHDSAEEQVGLDKELNFIESYISLQKLRLLPEQPIHYEVTGNVHGSAPPLILINFIENAFKYAQGSIWENDRLWYIFIQIHISGTDLVFSVKNGIRERGENMHKSGIGISNTQKRLAMLYGDKCDLKITATEDKYTVYLKIPLYD